MSLVRNLDCILEFEFVVLPIIVKPDANHGLETLFLCNGRNEFMALGAGEGANPPDVRLDNCESGPNLGLFNYGSRPLSLDIRAEGEAMNFVLENLANKCAQIVGRQG